MNSINLTLHLKEPDKEEETKAKVSRRKEIIKIGAEIYEIGNRKTKERSAKLRVDVFEVINKIDKY